MRTVLFIFGELNDQDIDWLIATGKKQKIEKGDILIEQNKQLSAVFIVLEGAFGVRVDNQKGKEIAQVGTGEILGEMSLLEARPPSVTVSALTASYVLAVPRRSLEEHLKREPAFAARFYKALAMFLSFRLRRLIHSKSKLDDDGESGVDELDSNVLDTVYLAGARFDRMLKRLS